jgi:hypothetical protein
VDRSVAQGRPGNPAADRETDARLDRFVVVGLGVGLVLAALAIYLVTYVDRYYDHFVWQASAFLEGQAAIRYPVPGVGNAQGNELFQDVLPVLSHDGVPRGMLPFPPLPAVVLMPFVALWGLATDDQRLFTALAAVDVATCWWMLGRLRLRLPVRLGTTIFFAFGTVFWYAAQNATTWYQAHIVAVGLTMLAVGIALGADPDAAVEEEAGEAEAEAATTAAIAEPWRAPPPPTLRQRLGVDPRQFLAGLLFGLAAAARLSVIFGAPFFLFVGGSGAPGKPGSGPWRRAWSAGVGAAIPVALLLGYNVASSGHLVQPAYDHLYRLEAAAYQGLGYHADWSIEDPRYLPQNAAIMFLTAPDLLPSELPDSLGVRNDPVCVEPDASRGLFDLSCPLAVPRDVGMSVLLTSPAFLLMLPALRGYGRIRLVTGASLAVVLIVVFNLMHFSQGWVQFGYRFSNDAVPFALPLVALGFERLVDGGRRLALPLAMALIVVSIAVNAWGVIWGTQLGW